MSLFSIKKLDQYIIKKFLGTFFYSIVLIVSIAIVFDFAERFEDFMDKNAPLDKILFQYYLNFIPYFANLFAQLFVFISVIFFTSKMAQNTEIIAILSNGVSFNRLLRPYFISAFVLAVLSFFLANFVIPHSTKRKLEFEYKYIRNPFRNDDMNIHRQISPGVFVYVESYSVENDMANKFSLEKFENGKLISKLVSDNAKWDSLKHRWTIYNYYTRYIQDDKDVIRFGDKVDTIINLSPADFKRRSDIVEAMDYFQLNEFIEKQKNEGSENIEVYQVQKYQRIINPLSIFVLTLIGVGVSSRKVRGGIGMHLGLGLMLSFSYILFIQISSNMSIGGVLPPIIGVCIPTFLYAILATYIYFKASK